MLMKTETFLSASDLGLRLPYYLGLRRVLTMLERGEFNNISILSANRFVARAAQMGYMAPYSSEEIDKKIKSFTMSVGCVSTECETVGCIMGWAAIFSGTKNWRSESDFFLNNIKFQFRENHSKLVRPNDWRDREYSQAQAAHALR